MKVAILTSFPADPASPRGGVEAVSVNLVAALARQPGVDVHVVTADKDCQDAQITKFETSTIHRLPRGSKKLLHYILNDGRAQIRAYLEQLSPSVVHAHDFYGMMITRLALPRAFTIHGFIHEDTKFARGRFSSLRAQLWKRYELASWADQPHIISISPYVRERLRGVARGVVHDIENPISPEAFELERHEDEGTIFCAAVISPRKNTLGLVQAFSILAKHHPAAKLRLAGSVVDSGYKAEIDDLLRSSGLANRVEFLGSIPATAVRKELSSASIFALPSFEEGAPMGVAEAMAAQVPVVTSNRCGMPYMVRDGESGYLIDPTNPAEIASRMSGLLGNPKLRRKMGIAARDFAMERFHPDRVAERTLRVYAAALDVD